MLVATILILFLKYDVLWWWYFLLFLGPDISAIGYLLGNKFGAFLYNLFHHKGIAILVWALGFIFHNSSICLIGIILFGHSSMDRFFGFGLKTQKGFQFTHLDNIKTKNK